MLSQKFVREHIDEIKDTINRQKKPELLSILDDFLVADEEWRDIKKEIDLLRSKRNKLSEEVNATKKAGGDIKPIIEQVKAIPAQIKEIELRLKNLEDEKIKPHLRKIPNIMHPDVPYGASDEDNVEVFKWGDITEKDVLNHVELCEKQGWADFEASAKTSGAGFYFLKGDLALLNQALIRFGIEHMNSAGYEYIEPPLMVKKSVLDAAMDTEGFEETIYQIKEKDDENSEVQNEPICMIGTAEHPILGMHINETLNAEELPKKYYGYSMCFRQEIGSHGINEKGLWRTHQFNKVEQFIFCTPEQTWDAYEELKKNTDELIKKLKLPYRIIEICTGDLALWKAKSHDFEVWRPTTKSYGEIMSLSNCTTYQATDLNIRYDNKGKRGIVHTLNNTALATSRIMVAILENYQNLDGTVNVPEVLQPLMFGKKVIGKKVR